jgi:oligo-1,6-glucosidase/alpha-glucosidase
VYQIYPRSYFDSNGDGIGDLPGIIAKLDYIKELGFETIWFSPFYASPQADFGYDIIDYQDIAPEYGTMNDCDQLIEEIHNRDLKIVLDMVLNHTSDQHPLFIESRSSRDNPKRNWFTWRDGRKPHGKAPPNNWRSMSGGSAWHYDQNTDQWYYAQFSTIQPDLNYRNPEVKDTMFNVLRFWLQKKIDGFRLDMIDAIYEDAEFRDNPLSWRLIPSDASHDSGFRSTKYILNYPDNFQFAKELREVMNEFSPPDRFLVGEVSGPIASLQNYCGPNDNGLHLAFLFKSLGAPLKAKIFKHLIQEYEKYFPFPLQPTWVFSNHDRMRRITRLGNNLLKAKLNCAFQMTVRGVPFAYYGEEIGQVSHSIPIKKSQDLIAIKYKKIPEFIWNFGRNVIHESINRDDCRTPMQWNDGPNAGFAREDVVPWLPVTPSFQERNVEKNLTDDDSILHCYQRFLHFRQEIPCLNSGLLELLNIPNTSQDVLAYKRSIQEENAKQEVEVYLNFGVKPISFKISKDSMQLLVSTTINSKPISGNQILLSSYEGIVLQDLK